MLKHEKQLLKKIKKYYYCKIKELWCSGNYLMVKITPLSNKHYIDFINQCLTGYATSFPFKLGLIFEDGLTFMIYRDRVEPYINLYDIDYPYYFNKSLHEKKVDTRDLFNMLDKEL